MHTPQTMAAWIGRVIAGERLNSRKTLSEVAKLSGLTVVDVKNIEAGDLDYFENWPLEDDPNSDVAKICKCLGIPMSSLPGADDGVVY
jgi:hypothetical protein